MCEFSFLYINHFPASNQHSRMAKDESLQGSIVFGFAVPLLSRCRGSTIASIFFHSTSERLQIDAIYCAGFIDTVAAAESGFHVLLQLDSNGRHGQSHRYHPNLLAFIVS